MMTYTVEMMIRRCVATVAGMVLTGWMAWDSYVLYQIMLAVTK